MITIRSILAIGAMGALTAAEIPPVDLLGGAGFNEAFLGVGLSVGDVRARDARRDFSAVRLGGSVYSISGYPASGQPEVGGLLGAAMLARGWMAHDKDVDWVAMDPCLALVGGGFWKTSANLRLHLTGEIGPGLSLAHFDDGTGGRSAYFRPTAHAGIHLMGMIRLDKASELGLIVGYDYDRLPFVTDEGPFIALAFTWKTTGGAKAP